LISWKYSFEKISKDLELARKKKQALDDLFNSGKISASTYESLDKELTEAIIEIEARQKDLAEKMASQIADLEKQINTLELFLANSEIRYAAGEIDEDLHANEIGAYTLGLDAVKQQLSTIKEIVAGLMPEVVAPTPPPTPSEAKPTEEVAVETLEATAETPIGTLVETPTEAGPISEDVTLEEPLETTEEVAAEEVTIEEPLKSSVETPTEEIVETTVETPAEEAPVEEEKLEETAEETVDTEEVAETYTEETTAEEEVETETEASAEETSYEEEEATEEETYE
jgi:hypothetical protein